MSSRKILLFIVTIALWELTACNYDVGECWRRGEGSEGAGAGLGEGDVFSSGASGDFGDAPPGEPLECNEPEESSKGSPKDSPKSPPQSPCQGVGDTPADGETYVFCTGVCSSQCVPAGLFSFSPDIFKFVTTLADDGIADPGGWQVASADLKIERWVDVLPESWSCPVTVGIPLRTGGNGPISPDYAAIITAQVATEATANAKKGWPNVPQGIFCSKIKPEMAAIFKRDFRSVGARMM